MLEEEGSIEDLFTPVDFKKYVLNDETLVYTTKNSEYMKTKKVDKVLSAKLFLDSLGSKMPKLEKTTEENITKLFTLLEEKFKAIKLK